MDASSRLASAIEHTLLSPIASRDDIVRLVDEAVEHRLFGVCVASSRVTVARERIRGHRASTKLVSVVGFPNGAIATSIVVAETSLAIADGADEIDVVAPLGLFRDGDPRAVLEHLGAVVAAAEGRPVKVILETGMLTDGSIRDLALIALDAGAKFLKTSTGIADRGGATVEHVALLRAIAGDRAGVKASGGIRTREIAHAMLDAGATRIGTSAGPRLVASGDLP